MTDSGQKMEATPSSQVKLKKRSLIKNKIVILSGKGGVGKSTIASNLANALSLEGFKVGLLDVDVHGPSIPIMMGLKGEKLKSQNDALIPAQSSEVKVMSLGFLLQQPDEPIIWRGPAKTGVIKQFIEDVEWGELDYLIVDCPPGTGDEPLSVCQLLEPAKAIIVTTPQEIALSDVKKSINFCHKIKLPILGLIENMSGFICPHCKAKTDLYSQGGGNFLSKAYSIPLLGSLPFNPEIGKASDQGKSFNQEHLKTIYSQFKPTIEKVKSLMNK